MARTTEMRLLELMVLKQDISRVIEYIGKKGNFQFQFKNINQNKIEKSEIPDIEGQFFEELKKINNELGFELSCDDLSNVSLPNKEDSSSAGKVIASYQDLQNQITEAGENLTKVTDAYKEAMSFSNLQVSYSELEHLSFLSLKIGKIAQENYDGLKESLEGLAVLVPIGNDKSHILVATSKKGRFALEAELKKYNFVELQIPSDFKGVPEDVLEGLLNKKVEAEKRVEELEEQKANYAETHKTLIVNLLEKFSLAVQIKDIAEKLESTELVYRVTGWLPATDVESYMKDLDEITEGRVAIRDYEPFEVPEVMSGKEDVPVKLTHGKLLRSFERVIFSYGSPVYGSIDPTPLVALFFTVLFGIMFGDCGQGLVLLLVGVLMAAKVIKLGGWEKFARVFMCIGVSSSLMGLLTGEFFGTEKLLEPFALWVTGLFGKPHAPIVKLMPNGSDPKSIYAMFAVFGVAVAIGFVINTCGLLINIINNIIKKKYGDAFFGKNGLAGAVFFWYVIALVLRMVLAHHKIAVYDWVIIGLSLFFAAFASPFERALNHEKPLLENGVGTYIISSLVEIIEVISGYLSNTVSFVRVGAFALSHAVLNFTILTLTNLCGGEGSIGGILVLILGNALIIVLEGMIVAIQVVRLQYYEFFSKFFHETGRDFRPFKFTIEN